MQIPALSLLRRAAVLGLAALVLTACSKTEQTEQHNNPEPSVKVADAPAAQNLQDTAIDFSAPPSGLNGGMKSLDAQGDIPQLLNQIHDESQAKK